MTSRFRALTTSSAVALAASTMAANSSSFTFDGVFSSDDAYTTDTQALWFNDHEGTKFGKTSLSYLSGEQTLRVRHGQGTDVSGDSTEFFWLLIDLPLGAKNMVWSDNRADLGDDLLNYFQQWSTHHCDASIDGGTAGCSSKKKKSETFDLTFDKAFGSEKLRFGNCNAKAGGKKGKAGSSCDFVVDPSGKDTTVSITDNLNDWMLAARTTVNWLVDLDPGCNTTSCFAADMEMSYEMKFDLAAKDHIIDLFAGGNADVNTHLSPERGTGQLSNIVSEVPLPASLPLLGASIAAIVALVRRRRKIV